MNRLQRLPNSPTYCLTLNDEERIDLELIVARLATRPGDDADQRMPPPLVRGS